MQRIFSPADILIGHADRVIRTLTGHAKTTGRPNPAADVTEDIELDDSDAHISAQLMRVNLSLIHI